MVAKSEADNQGPGERRRALHLEETCSRLRAQGSGPSARLIDTGSVGLAFRAEHEVRKQGILRCCVLARYFIACDWRLIVIVQGLAVSGLGRTKCKQRTRPVDLVCGQ